MSGTVDQALNPSTSIAITVVLALFGILVGLVYSNWWFLRGGINKTGRALSAWGLIASALPAVAQTFGVKALPLSASIAYLAAVLLTIIVFLGVTICLAQSVISDLRTVGEAVSSLDVILVGYKKLQDRLIQARKNKKKQKELSAKWLLSDDRMVSLTHSLFIDVPRAASQIDNDPNDQHTLATKFFAGMKMLVIQFHATFFPTAEARFIWRVYDTTSDTMICAGGTGDESKRSSIPMTERNMIIRSMRLGKPAICSLNASWNYETPKRTSGHHSAEYPDYCSYYVFQCKNKKDRCLFSLNIAIKDKNSDKFEDIVEYGLMHFLKYAIVNLAIVVTNGNIETLHEQVLAATTERNL